MAEQKVDNRFQITTKTGEVLTLDKKTVVKYLTDNVDITDSEFTMFFQLCKVNHVNPFLKEAYIIKYGSTPATIVLDYKVLQQIAEDHPSYKGMRHGVVVQSKDGKVEERLGSYVLPNETLLAGWCEVFRNDRDQPTKVVAMFEEFKGTKRDGTLNSNWRDKPCFMITKVAKAQALREAFPNSVGSNIYISEEVENMQPKEADIQPERHDTNISNCLVDEVEVEVEPIEPEEEEIAEQ